MGDVRGSDRKESEELSKDLYAEGPRGRVGYTTETIRRRTGTLSCEFGEDDCPSGRVTPLWVLRPSLVQSGLRYQGGHVSPSKRPPKGPPSSYTFRRPALRKQVVRTRGAGRVVTVPSARGTGGSARSTRTSPACVASNLPVFCTECTHCKGVCPRDTTGVGPCVSVLLLRGTGTKDHGGERSFDPTVVRRSVTILIIITISLLFSKTNIFLSPSSL